MALTEFQIRNARPATKIVKLSDGGGLQLWISPDGAKRWRLAYRFNEAQKTLAIGVYPATGLKEARVAREEAKRRLANGQDPSLAKKLEKAAKAAASANTFETIAAEFLDKKRREGKAESTVSKLEWQLRFVPPAIGARPIAELTAPEVLAVLRPVEARGRRDTAHRLRGTIGQVFRYAVATGRAENDPTSALKGALAAPIVKHRAAIIEPKGFGGLLRAIQTYEGTPETLAALELLALTFVRPGELRAAEWVEFDLEAATWAIPGERMKMKRPHRVPLAPQALEILGALREITGQGKFLFPSIRSASRCMSENTINAALRRLGFGKDEMTGHGFRSAASSILNESSLWNPDAIEAQLAHVESNKIRKAYARAEYWDERVRMMDWWADRCEEMRRGGLVLKFNASV
ncbi:tyrosine-type recombinase/integrase [Rhodoblastus sp. 17X3]|uniref:tyrosine-type recombinase/integrase n=1 Tax=Rhodoblastus sp. 17X3 TaxID=3047026 RepID=UPI0024B7CD55|nr:integrase arm-type DNA-binding domain-containing protein [Rhodoblastus sp. 17X3]MDI9847320.1 tyrosine-type recombinase/integrase [Rhodoblastus sp. 17X3]